MELLKGKKLSQREKVLLILVAVAAVAALFYYCVYNSQVEKIASIKSQLTENQKKLNELKGFDGQLKTLEKEVDKLDADIELATKDWFPSLRQDIIIKDLEKKIQSTNLKDGTVNFKSSQVASIADFDDTENPPTIAEALALSFVTLMQEKAVPTPAPVSEEDTDDGKNIIQKASEVLSAPTPTPGPDGDETTTALGNQAALSGKAKTKTKDGELDPEVQAKLDALKKSLTGLTEKELQEQINTILANTTAKVDKMEIAITFTESSYKSIMDFVNKVEKTSPNIYVSKIEFTDNTDEYVSKLLEEATAAEQTRVAINNLFVTSTENQLKPREVDVKYIGTEKYSGSISLVYFAVSKIHRDDMAN